MDKLYLQEKKEGGTIILDCLRKERNDIRENHLNTITNEHTLDASLHSFDPNKCSPPNNFFVKSMIRLKRY